MADAPGQPGAAPARQTRNSQAARAAAAAAAPGAPAGPPAAPNDGAPPPAENRPPSAGSSDTDSQSARGGRGRRRAGPGSDVYDAGQVELLDWEGWMPVIEYEPVIRHAQDNPLPRPPRLRDILPAVVRIPGPSGVIARRPHLGDCGDAFLGALESMTSFVFDLATYLEDTPREQWNGGAIVRYVGTMLDVMSALVELGNLDDLLTGEGVRKTVLLHSHLAARPAMSSLRRGIASQVVLGQVQARLPQWRAIKAPSDVRRWLRDGVPVQFTNGRPPPHYHHGDSAIDPEAAAWWESEKMRYLATGAIERTSEAKYVSRAFVVPKGSGGWRLVVDLRPLNRYCDPMPCHYGALKQLRTLARRGDYMVSFDLRDGYHHVPIRPSDRKYFTFSIEGELFRCAGLPFGWSQSPAIFTRVMQPVVKAMRRMGAGVVPYLDDFLLLYPNKAEAWRGSKRVQHLLTSLGLSAHPTKSDWVPGQVREHLGMVVDLDKGEFRVSSKRLSKLRAAAGHLQVVAKSAARRVTARQLASFIGLAASCQLAVPVGRLYLREFYDILSTRQGSWSSPVRLTRQALRDLDFWRGVTRDGSAGPIWLPAIGATLHTDSSDYAWGGVLGNRIPVRGDWDEKQRQLHITLKELMAVRRTIEHFIDELHGRAIKIYCDNQAVVHVMTTWTSRSPALMAELRELWTVLEGSDATVQMLYIRSEANTFADHLSRVIDRGSYRLRRDIFERIAARFGPFTVDRFATPANTQCPRFNTLLPTPDCEGADAFSQDWRGEENYAFPPVDLLPRTLQFIREQNVQATVIAPLWPSASWWQGAMRDADDVMYIHERHCLVQGSSDEPVPPNQGLPWANLAKRLLRDRLGSEVGEEEVDWLRDQLARSVRNSTNSDYRSWLNRYLAFCEMRTLAPLPADSTTAWQYYSHLSQHLAPASVKAYISALNNLHTTCGYPPAFPLDDPLYKRLMQGLQAIRAQPHQIGSTLPATAAWAVLQDGLRIDDGDLRALRDATALVIGFRAMLRSTTLAKLEVGDVRIVREPAPVGAALQCMTCRLPITPQRPLVRCVRCDTMGHADCLVLERARCEVCREPDCLPVTAYESRFLALQLRHLKTAAPGEVRELKLSLRGCPDVAHLVDRYAHAVRLAWSLRQHLGVRTQFFQLPGEAPFRTGSHVVTTWIRRALERAGHGDLGLTLTSHALRRGGASAAMAVDAPRASIEYQGCWVMDSTAFITRYVDFSMAATREAGAFFRPTPLA